MAQAKWLVMVDWNDDATSDVRGLTLEHFRDLSNEHIEAARLELELNNDDHKYSPSNSGSPLSGDLKPGRKAWVRAAYPFDGFSGAAGTQLQDHEPEYDSGFAWAEHLQGFDIAPGGTAAQTDGTQGNGDCVATLDFADADVSFGCDFNRGTDTTDHGGLCFRFLDASNYLYVRITGSVIELRKVDAGADSLVASAAHTWGTSTGKFLQAVLHGDSIRVFVDGTEVLDTTSSFNSAATRHGLFSDDEADHTWDNFGGWVSLFYGTVDSIHPRPRRGAQYCYLRALDEMERLTSVTLYMTCTLRLSCPRPRTRYWATCWTTPTWILPVVSWTRGLHWCPTVGVHPSGVCKRRRKFIASRTKRRDSITSMGTAILLGPGLGRRQQQPGEHGVHAYQRRYYSGGSNGVDTQ